MTREPVLNPCIGIARCIGLAAVLALTLISARVSAETEKPTDAALVLESDAFDSPKELTAALKKSGVIVRHVFWPRVVLAHVPQQSEATARSLPGVVDLYRQRFEPTNAVDLSRTEQAGIVAWNMHFAADRLIVSDDFPPPAGYPDKRAAALRAPLPDSPASPVPMGGTSAPYGADFYDTSEYMIGTVAVGVVFIESDGTIDPSTENWTQAEEDFVFSEVVQGYNEWAAASNFELTFFYQSEDSVLTGYEPINRSAGDQQLWLPQIMSALGYPGTNYFQTTREYLNDLRDTLNTDWAIITFQIDATNDADGVTPDGYGANAYYGGPFNYVAYDDDALAIPHDDLCAKMLGYNFWALPESPYVECDARTGYLNSENQNSEFPGGCNLNAACRMRISCPNFLCAPTKRQVGWQDGDGDGLPLILDTDPVTALNDGTIVGLTVSYSGDANVNPRVNLNPWGQQHNISLNTITSVEYRVDGGPWVAANPSDGAFDTGGENYEFTTQPLAPGGHLVEARALSNVGNTDLSFASDSVNIQPVAVPTGTTSPIHLSLTPNPFSSSVEISYRVPGSGSAEVRVHDAQGRLVWKQDVTSSAGVTTWDGVGSSGNRQSPGVYFVTVRSSGSKITREVVLMR